VLEIGDQTCRANKSKKKNSKKTKKKTGKQTNQKKKQEKNYWHLLLPYSCTPKGEKPLGALATPCNRAVKAKSTAKI
jgi:hypothetical protein